MHIISSPGAGGAEIYVKDLAIAMVGKQHEVLILFLNKAQDIGRDTAFQDDFLAMLAAKGIRYEFIGYKARRNPLLGAYRVHQSAKAFRPDIIHCHLYYAAIFALFTHGAKIIYTHHSIKLCAPAYIYRLLDLRIASYVGVCEACKLMLQTVTRRPVVLINNAVEPQRIIFRQSKTVATNGTVVILVVGRLSEEKNLPLLFHALTRLNDLDFVVHVAGEGPDKEDLKRLVDQLDLTEKVQFLGNVSNVPALMSQSDIYAMSSAWEGLPIALIEATLTGLAVIVTDVGGCAEVVRHANNGIVVHELQPAAYALELRRLIGSKKLRDQFSKNALDNSQQYKLTTSVDAHLALYDSLVAQAHAV